MRPSVGAGPSVVSSSGLSGWCSSSRLSTKSAEGVRGAGGAGPLVAGVC